MQSKGILGGFTKIASITANLVKQQASVKICMTWKQFAANLANMKKANALSGETR